LTVFFKKENWRFKRVSWWRHHSRYPLFWWENKSPSDLSIAVRWVGWDNSYGWGRGTEKDNETANCSCFFFFGEKKKVGSPSFLPFISFTVFSSVLMKRRESLFFFLLLDPEKPFTGIFFLLHRFFSRVFYLLYFLVAFKRSLLKRSFKFTRRVIEYSCLNCLKARDSIFLLVFI